MSDTSIPPISQSPTDQFFRDLELEGTRPLVSRSMATIERLHAPEYQLITPVGKIFSREKYFAATAEAPFYTRWDAGEIGVRSSPTMAVVR